MCCPVKVVLELELIGTSMDEKTLVSVHGAKFEAGACGFANEGRHLVLVLAKENAIVSLAHGLQDSIVHLDQRCG